MQSLLNKYIWSQGPHHMLANLIYQPRTKGRFGMVDLLSFDKALKLSWLFKVIDNNTDAYALQLKACLKVPIRTFLTFNLQKTHLRCVCTCPLSPFWDNVLRIWYDLHYTTSKGHLGLMPLAFNSALVTSTRNQLFDLKAIAAYEAVGITTVSDFVEQYDHLTCPQKAKLGAYCLYDQIPSDWLTGIDSNNLGNTLEIEALSFQSPSVRVCYQLLLKLKPPVVNKAIVKWENDFNVLLADKWESICSKYKCLVEVHLQSFYLRFVNRCMSFNYHRSKYTPGLSPLCSYCHQYNETF